jgi:TRAP-type transport system small permease protein
METCARIVRLSAKAAFLITMAGLVIITVLTFADVCMRYLFNKPIYGALDVIRLLLIVAVACSLGQTQLARGHIVIDLFSGALKGRPKAVLDSVYDAISFGLFFIIAWQTFKHAVALHETGDAVETLVIPFYPFLYVISVNAMLVCVVLLFQILTSLKEVVGR